MLVIKARYQYKKDEMMKVTLLEDHSKYGFVLVRFKNCSYRLNEREFRLDYRRLDD